MTKDRTGARGAGRAATLAALAASLVAAAACGGSASGAAGRRCAAGERWVNAWQAPPSDAWIPIDASLRPLVVGPAQTFRLILTPLGSGSAVRVRLSNRFGARPATLGPVRIARRLRDADVDAATSVPALFGGAPTVTIPAGEDAVSDPADFAVGDFDDLAVSVFAADPGAAPTGHRVARQRSFATLPFSGDRTADASGAAFAQSVTLRPFVAALDALAPPGAAAAVAFGDSLTDGFQAPRAGLPEDPETLDRNERYPDFLRRRLLAAGRDVFVSNAGISGNRVLAAGLVPPFGPSALSRLDADVLDRAGVTDVLLWEGINDIGQTAGLAASDLIDGYVEAIDRMHARGLNVIQGTLTPSRGSGEPGPGDPRQAALRRAVNEWIRTRSPADAVVDFDAAVRDPADPDVIDARYDGGDGLHFSAAGNERLAEAVDLGSIRGAACP